MLSLFEKPVSYQFLLLVVILIVGLVGFGLFFVAVHSEVHSEFLWPNPYTFYVIGSVVFSILCLPCLLVRREDWNLQRGWLSLSVLPTSIIVICLSTAYQMGSYVSLPVDLLSFAESPFVNDILKFRLGLPIYTEPEDNNSYPYAPGTQILTYLISAAFGRGESIPFFRAVQFSYVILACLIAASLCDLLARKFLLNKEYTNRPLWLALWIPALFLCATAPDVNPYTHSLHNDGLALLVSITCFWVMAKYAHTPRNWLLWAMALLPSLGFLVKQSLAVWLAFFLLFLFVGGATPIKKTLYVGLTSVIFVVVSAGLCYLMWGEHFFYWTFVALGDKKVSVFRSILHLFDSGIYMILGLVGGWILVVKNISREKGALWLSWILMFSVEVYTSGIGWVSNHLGPGSMIAMCWFLAGLVKIWPKEQVQKPWWESRIQEAVIAISIICLFGALNLIRVPLDPVPQDFFRYVEEIEQEFNGEDPSKVLLDYGTWIYLKRGVSMKDRSASVSLHVGKNQPINHEILSSTIQRIQTQQYDKILARQLDTEHTAYDFQDRGSGVKDAIFSSYRLVRRISRVENVGKWWPNHLIEEVLVFVPKDKA